MAITSPIPTDPAKAVGQSVTPVIDYEGSQYKTNFWEGQGRTYEDAVERLVIQQLLPNQGGRIAEIGAGFGRLANLYVGYDQIILFDYSRTLLEDAVKQWGHDPRFIFVAGNIYQLPLATGILDSMVMVRVMHHLANVPLALQQIKRVLHRHSVGIIEYANKRNLKALLRWLAGRQTWSPFKQTPLEFVELNFDFHPTWMQKQLHDAHLAIQAQRAVSHFRWPLLKAHIDAEKLAKTDNLLSRLGGLYPLAPSVFVQVTAPSAGARANSVAEGAELAKLFCCPACTQQLFKMVENEQLLCEGCGIKYGRKFGIWDFKEGITA